MEYEIKEQLSNSKYFTAFQRKLVTINGPLGMVLKVKRLTETATLPTFGDPDAAGCDLYADLNGENSIIVRPGSLVAISTGVACEFPEGYFGLMLPRSSVGTKRELVLANTAGVLDWGYRGDIMMIFRNVGNKPQEIHHGERLAQMILLPYVKYSIEDTDTLSETERGEDGFGSTGK